MKRFEDILNLKKQSELKIQNLGSRANNAQKILNNLLTRPVTDVKKVGEIAGVSQRTAYNLINDLEELGILKKISSSKRGSVYAFKDYLNLFD